VQADERLLQSQVSHISGRIERLMVNYTGEKVKKGQTLALIYSPELVTAQQELLEAAKTKQTEPEIYEAVKEKLRRWMLPESLIAGIEHSGTIQNNIEVVSNTSGIVTARRVNYGDYISQGTILFEVADLSKLWVLFDAYESDMQFLQQGDRLEFNVQALPGKKFSGNISFIDPFIDPVTRVAKVRIETDNRSGNLKPEMFVTGLVKARLDEYSDKMVIPKTAVLWTGTRSIVYVKQGENDDPVFKMREIGLGPLLGNSYVVTDGLREGEEIVTRGAFSIDAAAQLEGKPSMMNPPGGNSSGLEREAGKELYIQFNSLFDQYIGLKDVLVQSDVNKAMQAALKVRQSIAQLDMKLMTGDAHEQWMKISEKLDNSIVQISSSTTIEAQRKAYADFTGDFYTTIKIFGLIDKTVFYQYCPMAFDGKGAYWLSTTREIRNPYFGDAMLTCGETKETLEY
jgi:Cu(I)/Ag(I) efflux system membrane fusion protein